MAAQPQTLRPGLWGFQVLISQLFALQASPSPLSGVFSLKHQLRERVGGIAANDVNIWGEDEREEEEEE